MDNSSLEVLGELVLEVGALVRLFSCAMGTELDSVGGTEGSEFFDVLFYNVYASMLWAKCDKELVL